MKTNVVTPCSNRLTVLTRGHHICLHLKMRKIIFELSLLPFLSRALHFIAKIHKRFGTAGVACQQKLEIVEKKDQFTCNIKKDVISVF